jgi:hypothetical protein
VLDTGIQTNHPDLNVVQAVDFTGDGSNGNDWDGHGTSMAGVIGALDNDFGVVGVAPGVRLWSIQIITSCGGLGDCASWADVLAGVDYVAANADRIAVVNASFGSNPDEFVPYEAIHQAVSNVVSRGVVVVAAGGNDGIDILGGDHLFGTLDDILPAALPEVMAVSAMDPVADAIWEGSNYSISDKVPSYVTSPGAGFDVTAPGVGILSTTIGTNYTRGTGTSDATAHVSGLVALYIAANGRATNAEGVYRIRQAIVDSAQPQSQWENQDSDPDGNPEPLAIPSEAWIPQPRIVSQSMTPQNFKFRFTTVPGYRYTPQHTDSLTVSNQWTDLTATDGTGAPATASDPVLNAVRYYRVARSRWPLHVPVIVGQPQDKVVSPGTNVLLSVALEGDPPFSYQWQFGETNLTDDLRINGSWSDRLEIRGAVASDAGAYRVIITNGFGAVTSAVATLIVLGADAQAALAFSRCNSHVFPNFGYIYTAGWTFTVSNAVWVRALGWFDAGSDGLVHSHGVGIFTRPMSETGVLLVSARVTAADCLVDGFRYRPIGSLLLPPGDYVVAGTAFTDPNQVSCGSVATHPNISFGEGRFIDGPTFAFPTRPGGGFGYFGPNFILSAATP